MHKIIRFIIEADTKEEALKKAKTIGDEELFGEGRDYDYGTFFDEEGSISSGKGRWGDLPDAVLVNSKEGKELIDEGMKYTKAKFIDAIKYVRGVLTKYTDEEIFEGELTNIKSKMLSEISNENKLRDLSMAKFYFHKAGYKRETFLYSGYGEAIQSNKELKGVLESKKTKFVVPCDVHY